MTNQQLDQLILESQDFPEVDVKGLKSWKEEFAYLIKRIFDKNQELYVTPFNNKHQASLGYRKKLSDANSNCFLNNLLEGTTGGYSVGEVIYLGKKEGFFSGYNYPVEIRSTENKIMQERRTSLFSPLTIKVHDSSFFEPAKLFAKTYTKWCGQEATVIKEFVENEEKAREIIRLEEMINSSKEVKKENINQLEPETVIEKRPGHLYEIDLVNEAKSKIEQIIKDTEGSKKYKTRINNSSSRNLGKIFYNWGEHRNSPSDYIASIHISFGEKMFLGAADMLNPSGSMHIEISGLNFNERYDKEQAKYKINVDVNSSKHLEYLTRVGTRLKEEFNAPLIIKPNY